MIQNDFTLSGWRLISSSWHPCWRRWFPNTPFRSTVFTLLSKPQTQFVSGACSVFAIVASILQQHSETSHRHTQWRHLNISWTRCAEIDWAEDICPVLSTLFTPISCGWAHLCWQRTRWEIVICSILLRFNYFYPCCEFFGAGMTSLLHFHAESFIQRRQSWRLTST